MGRSQGRFAVFLQWTCCVFFWFVQSPPSPLPFNADPPWSVGAMQGQLKRWGVCVAITVGLVRECLAQGTYPRG